MSWWTDVRDAFTAPFRQTVRTFDHIFFGGKNVFDEVKALGFTLSSAPLAQIDALSGKNVQKLNIPLLSDTTESASELIEDPYRKGAQGRAFQRSLRNTAVVAGAVYGGPVVAEYTNLSAGASTAVAGKLSYDLASGNFAGAIKTGLGVVSPIETPFGSISPNDLVSKFTASVGQLPRSPVENYQTPSQTVVYNPPGKISPILIFAGIAGVTFLVIKLRKKA